jgi:hypothetical protein
MTIKVELVKADPESVRNLVEKVIAIRDPKLAATRAKNYKKAVKEDKTYSPTATLEHVIRGSASFKMSGYSFKASPGLLNTLNREFSESRCDAYVEDMDKGRWWFTPDPIVITDDGHIINGQHRLVAVCRIKWDDGIEPPTFVVVWGVDKRAALLMDEARRSNDDRRNITVRYAGSA